MPSARLQLTLKIQTLLFKSPVSVCFMLTMPASVFYMLLSLPEYIQRLVKVFTPLVSSLSVFIALQPGIKLIYFETNNNEDQTVTLSVH